MRLAPALAVTLLLGCPTGGGGGSGGQGGASNVTINMPSSYTAAPTQGTSPWGPPTHASDPGPIALGGGAADVSLPAPSPPAQYATVVDFDKAGLSAHHPSIPAGAFLANYGITVIDVTPGTAMVIEDSADQYGGTAVDAPSFLTQIITDNTTARPLLAKAPARFVLLFQRPMSRVIIERAGLIAGQQSGVTHPAWTATALNAKGAVVASQGESLLRYMPGSTGSVRVRPQPYALVAVGFDGITALRVDSDYRLDGVPFAGYIAMLVDRIELVPCDEHCR